MHFERERERERGEEGEGDISSEWAIWLI